MGPPTTTPTGPPVHGTSSARGLARTPSSALTQGRFGRMFRSLPVFAPAGDDTDAELARLAQRMAADFAPADLNADIPSGYTYLGQFIDHDITFDPVSSLARQNDPDALVSFRTPRYDLDSLYGRGPADQPYLYEPKGDGSDPAKLLLGREVARGTRAHDLPRMTGSNVALIGDPRNDENLIVSQLHQVFLRFHNAVVDHVRGSGFAGGDDDVFKEAQRLVRWHYQWVVVHDFLRRVAGPEVVGDILRPRPYAVCRLDGGGFVAESIPLTSAHLRFYGWEVEPFMPVEFSVAAYRFGHSMIRGRYFINDFLKNEAGADAFPIFGASTRHDNTENLNGGRPLPDDWGFEWKFFFDGLTGSAEAMQPSFMIDDRLAAPLNELPSPPPPEAMRSLAQRNLVRGVRLELPSGQAVAAAMGIPPLSDEELDLAGVAPSFVQHAPLWYYVLREAKLRCGGRRLGPVGGRIVAEVLIGLLAGDPLSYLRVAPNWTPGTLSAEHGASFGMPELIRFAGAAS